MPTMNELQLYRKLQAHVGELNRLVVELYNGTITVAEAVDVAKPAVDSLKVELDAEAGA